MERHKCKLCTRTFANGRALGGHMKAHLATLPLPPRTTAIHQQQQQLGAESASSSYSSSGEEHEHEHEQEMNSFEVEEKALVYGLRENPKRNLNLPAPIDDDDYSVVSDA
ncbi:hypothetical protein RCOM_1060190 [Ricinus communis]|uniref:C2H2-type domain-containing protein n=1 Tax=Ricinus communis TaxID=3988 RepID=B9SSE6_RICCO|nr:hypothetical protein RCOM_1060190 [Ricinus communis]